MEWMRNSIAVHCWQDVLHVCLFWVAKLCNWCTYSRI